MIALDVAAGATWWTAAALALAADIWLEHRAARRRNRSRLNHPSNHGDARP